MNDPTTHRAKLRRIWPLAAGALTAVIVAGWSIASLAPTPARAVAEPVQTALPAPPKDGVMGFVVESFVPPVVQGKDACPHGLAPRLKDEFLATLPAAEAARLRLKANEKEFTERWHAMAFGPKNETNICSQPDLFSRPPFPGVESKTGWGLDLDRKTGGSDPDGCAHDEFQTPNGEQGIDNQEYRAMGCTLEWRGVDGVGGDIQSGLRQFHASGEWTQVLLLRGVTSFVKADNVEVIYANTPDRPVLDSKGHFLPGMSFSVSDKPPRHRNVLHGRIRNGVLTTDPAEIELTETWGQGGARDIRGNRSSYHYFKGRMKLEFQPDGTLKGLVGGYRPLMDVIISPALGGAGSALVAGIDCAAELATLKKYADGMRDPQSGQCHGISSAMRLSAVPAFVNDLPKAGAKRETAR
ncbi:MAG: hypothetical protein NVSMB69_17940 [Novosphingobium sp.]